MKPSRAQYFFARLWPLRIFFACWLIGLPLGFVCVTTRHLTPLFLPLTSVGNVVRAVFLILITSLLALLVALVTLSLLVGMMWPLCRPLYRWRCVVNGAPFQVGDQVKILTGRYRNRAARVCHLSPGDDVRVESLGNDPEKFETKLSLLEIARECSGSAN